MRAGELANAIRDARLFNSAPTGEPAGAEFMHALDRSLDLIAGTCLQNLPLILAALDVAASVSDGTVYGFDGELVELMTALIEAENPDEGKE